MNAQNFCYWLQGYAEIHGEVPTKEKWDIIMEHLNIVEELKPAPTQLSSTSTMSGLLSPSLIRGSILYC